MSSWDARQPGTGATLRNSGPFGVAQLSAWRCLVFKNPDDSYDFEKLGRKLIHLNALLLRTYGEDGELLHDSCAAVQDNYLWACSELASECNDLHTKLNMTMIRSKA
jgi:hypothetical protein